MLSASRQVMLKRKEHSLDDKNWEFSGDTHLVSNPSCTTLDSVKHSMASKNAGCFFPSQQQHQRFVPLRSWLPRVRDLKELGWAVRDASWWERTKQGEQGEDHPGGRTKGPAAETASTRAGRWHGHKWRESTGGPCLRRAVPGKQRPHCRNITAGPRKCLPAWVPLLILQEWQDLSVRRHSVFFASQHAGHSVHLIFIKAQFRGTNIPILQTQDI